MLARQAGRCVVGLHPFLLFWDRRSVISGLQERSGLERGTVRQVIYRMAACGGRVVGGGFAVATGEREGMASRYVLSRHFRPDGAVFRAAGRPGQKLSGD